MLSLETQMLLQLLLLVLVLAPTLHASANFNYFMFENFVKTEKAFQEEIYFRQKLLQLREELQLHREEIGEAQVLDPKDEIQKLSSLLSIRKTNNQAMDKALGNSTTHFATLPDYRGALRGFLMLKETYRFNVEKLLEGRLRLFSPMSEREEVFSSSHRLGIHDLVDLSGTAVGEGWFDDAVDLVRVGMKLLDESGALSNASLPTHLREHLQQLPRIKSFLPRLHNDYLEKRRAVVGHNFKVFPYLVDDELKKRKRQPKSVAQLAKWRPEPKDIMDGGDHKEHWFRRVCRREVEGEEVKKQIATQRCRWLHHHDPFLRLAPFKMEVLLGNPFRMVLHHFFSESEMRWIVDYSRPRLSLARFNVGERVSQNKPDSKTRRLIHKSVQTWMADMRWSFPAEYAESPDGDGFVLLDFAGDREAGEVVMPVLRRLAQKMEAATTLKVRPRFSSTDFQTTNYGLGGLCETHIDPYGVLEGATVRWDQRHLYSTGDFIATTMGWLDDVPAGGETAFDYPGYSQVVTPKRGSMAFWIDLNRAGKREVRSSHGGCPVAVGSKWILNKWVYYFNQFHKFPCGLSDQDEYEPFTGVY